MIVVKITGKIENQMFQYATARALSLRLGTDLFLELSKLEQNPLWLEHFNIVAQQKHFDVKLNLVKEIREVFDLRMFSIPDNSFLDGNFNFEKYFHDQAEQIRREFTLKNPISEENLKWEYKIRSEPIPISIHIPRRESDSVSLKYFDRCVEILKANFPNLSIYVFTNDISWCTQNIQFSTPTNFIDSSSKPHEEIFLMNLCKHHVISDSIMSFWGAWLDSRDSSLVLIPSEYIRKPYADKHREFVPARWMIINF